MGKLAQQVGITALHPYKWENGGVSGEGLQMQMGKLRAEELLKGDGFSTSEF